MKEHKNEPDSVYETLVIDGVEYPTLLTTKYKSRRPYIPKDFGLVTAFIPGTIIEVDVKEGEIVKHGQRVVVLEAMKMLNQLAAPFDAKVISVNVAAGDHVTKNQVLVELKEIVSEI